MRCTLYMPKFGSAASAYSGDGATFLVILLLEETVLRTRPGITGLGDRHEPELAIDITRIRN